MVKKNLVRMGLLVFCVFAGIYLQFYFNIVAIVSPGLVRPVGDLGTKSLWMSAIERKTRNLVEELKMNKDYHQIGVFYQDLRSLESFGINADLEFSAASLLKVPVLMAYFRAARIKPDIIKEKIKYEPEKHSKHQASQVIEPPEPLKPGEFYPVNYLLARMITISDNVATDMLVQQHPEVATFDLLKEMQIKIFNNRDGNDIITVASYASIFRILYNVEFLTENFSKATLEMLKLSHYKNGLVKGVPEGIEVAHKFGERTVNQTNQLHDCGIVYHPQNPYILCVMTRGQGFALLQDAIQKISKEVYQSVSAGNY